MSDINYNRTKRELVYHGVVIDVYQDTMDFGNGKTAIYDYVHHNGAAAVVPVTDEGKILMVRQYRNALDRMTLEIPAGKLDSPDEEGIECARRELEEETGFRSDNIKWLLNLYGAIGYCDEKIQVFTATNLIPSKQNLDEDEYIDVEAHSVEELKNMIFTGQIEDSKTIAGILGYEVSRKE
ncbi:MAG: NUDIX hydrolase [Lachnospiraceae bacterium]|jgi:ADP-ribose pyrophosphatase|nr:NUDIX hydrolase [Lachnospiraceae bacterium]